MDLQTRNLWIFIKVIYIVIFLDDKYWKISHYSKKNRTVPNVSDTRPESRTSTMRIMFLFSFSIQSYGVDRVI